MNKKIIIFSGVVLVVGATVYITFGAIQHPDFFGAQELVINGILLLVATYSLTYLTKTNQKRMAAIIAMGLFAHGIWDLLHLTHLTNPLLFWLTVVCIVVDWVLAALLLLLLKKSKIDI